LTQHKAIKKEEVKKEKKIILEDFKIPYNNNKANIFLILVVSQQINFHYILSISIYTQILP